MQITAWWTLRKCHKKFLIILEKIAELLIKGSSIISAVAVTDIRRLSPQYRLFLQTMFTFNILSLKKWMVRLFRNRECHMIILVQVKLLVKLEIENGIEARWQCLYSNISTYFPVPESILLLKLSMASENLSELPV